MTTIDNFMDKKIEKGDLAFHTSGIDKDSATVFERVGIVLEVNPVLGSGFQSAEIMWCEDGEVETVMINYLKPVQKL